MKTTDIRQLQTKSFSETQQFGFDFAKHLAGGEVLALSGDLGSGKTTFVQGLAKGFGIDQRIISPTFLIIRTYQIRAKGKAQRAKSFYHIDLYRIDSEHEIEGLGLLELLGDKENIIAIEWPEKLGKLLPQKARKISFNYIDEDTRKIEVQS